MEKETALSFLDQEINGRYDTQGKRRKFIDFIVGEKSFIEGDFKTADSKVHVEGSYVFSPDLELRITADGKWDHERTMLTRNIQLSRNNHSIEGGKEPFYDYIDHEHNFEWYRLDASIKTDIEAHLGASGKIEFGSGLIFNNGKLEISYPSDMDPFRKYNRLHKYLESDMFAQIRLLGQVGSIEDFVRFGIGEHLNENQKQLEAKIETLGLNSYPIEYRTAYVRTGDYSLAPSVMVEYEDPDTLVGFKIYFNPVLALDPDKYFGYIWIVSIPADTPDKLRNIFNSRFKILDVDYFGNSFRAYFERPEYVRTEGNRIEYKLNSEETFVQTFTMWERALHVMKYGKPLELKAGIFFEDK